MLKNNPTRQQKTSKLSVLLFLIVILVGLVAIIYHFQYLRDWVIGYNYQPTTPMNHLIAKIKITPQLNHILKATKPNLQTAVDFNQNCQRREANNYILGCYTGDDKIYIFDVPDEELAGVEEVTLAHELLHAVYERMFDEEKTKINQLLEADYRRLKDADLTERMKIYERTEPGQFHNELHSILGTEVSKLHPDLEKHYRQYFTNRQIVVEFNQTYNQKFKVLADRRQDLNHQIDDLKTKIVEQEKQYKSQVDQLEIQIKNFNNLADSPGGFGSQRQFNYQRNLLTNRKIELKNFFQDINDNINRVNKLVAEYNKIVYDANKLNRSLDSLQSAPTL